MVFNVVLQKGSPQIFGLLFEKGIGILAWYLWLFLLNLQEASLFSGNFCLLALKALLFILL